MPWELCPEVFWRDSQAQKLDFRGQKGQFDVKKANFRGLITKNPIFEAYFGF